MDTRTLRTVAALARERARRGSCGTGSDGLMRLGSQRALTQLAADLDATAMEFERSPPNLAPFRA